ncbi:MAG: hypothetical protein IPL99_17970 [Candidatus Competibacteraceae bacterium]|nr:hypothetical protein [Candidatus Competibacteraceae bacterium]
MSVIFIYPLQVHPWSPHCPFLGAVLFKSDSQSPGLMKHRRSAYQYRPKADSRVTSCPFGGLVESRRPTVQRQSTLGVIMEDDDSALKPGTQLEDQGQPNRLF